MLPGLFAFLPLLPAGAALPVTPGASDPQVKKGKEPPAVVQAAADARSPFPTTTSLLVRGAPQLGRALTQPDSRPPAPLPAAQPVVFAGVAPVARVFVPPSDRAVLLLPPSTAIYPGVEEEPILEEVGAVFSAAATREVPAPGSGLVVAGVAPRGVVAAATVALEPVRFSPAEQLGGAPPVAVVFRAAPDRARQEPPPQPGVFAGVPPPPALVAAFSERSALPLLPAPVVSAGVPPPASVFSQPSDRAAFLPPPQGYVLPGVEVEPEPFEVGLTLLARFQFPPPDAFQQSLFAGVSPQGAVASAASERAPVQAPLDAVFAGVPPPSVVLSAASDRERVEPPPPQQVVAGVAQTARVLAPASDFAPFLPPPLDSVFLGVVVEPVPEEAGAVVFARVAPPEATNAPTDSLFAGVVPPPKAGVVVFARLAAQPSPPELPAALPAAFAGVPLRGFALVAPRIVEVFAVPPAAALIVGFTPGPQLVPPTSSGQVELPRETGQQSVPREAAQVLVPFAGTGSQEIPSTSSQSSLPGASSGSNTPKIRS